MAKGGEKERPATDGKPGVKKRRRGKRILDSRGRYIKPKSQPKEKPTEQPIAGIVQAPSVVFRRKRKSRAKHQEAKQQHAVTQKEMREMRLRDRVLSLRYQGASIKQISEQLKISGEDVGTSPASVQRLLVAGLKDLHDNYSLSLRHNVQLELQKIDAVELAHLRKLLDPDLSADQFEKRTRGMERIWSRRDGLLGLLKPQKVELSARDSLAKLLGRRPEEIPDGNADS